jgi:2-keto-4-pentenoate hydratase
MTELDCDWIVLGSGFGGSVAGLWHRIDFAESRPLGRRVRLRTRQDPEALRLGVVSRVVEDPLAAALVLAKQIAAVPGHAGRSIKDSLLRGAATDVPNAIHDIEAPAQAELVCHPDFSTNAAAWLSRHAEATR